MIKHGNTKYRFSQLQAVGDSITERPHNIYSLKAAFRAFNKKLIDAKEPALKVRFDEYGGKRVDIVLEGFIDPKLISNEN